MEPQIQYTKTSDGVNIAYATAGEGRCVIAVPSAPLSHAQRVCEMFPELFQGLAQRFRAIWYDSRGSGLSDRDALDFSMGYGTRPRGSGRASGVDGFRDVAWLPTRSQSPSLMRQSIRRRFVPGPRRRPDEVLAITFRTCLRSRGGTRSGDWPCIRKPRPGVD